MGRNTVLLKTLDPASATARGNAVRIMIRTVGINSMIGAAIATLRLAMANAAKIDRVCPSVCPSDWDKRKTPFVSAYAKATYERRFQIKRRGGDSNPRTPFESHGFSKPAHSTTLPPLQVFTLQGLLTFHDTRILLTR